VLKPKGVFKGKKVAVLMGGPSGEREVSLRSGAAILKALQERGYHAMAIDAHPDLVTELKREKVEVCYNALHGTFGEDGVLQGLLESARIPYTGSGVSACVLTMDKIITKRLLALEHIPTAEDVVVKKSDLANIPEIPFPGPYVVKPAREGSSLGISICENKSQLPNAVGIAAKFEGEILIEKFIAGRELTVGIVGNAMFPSVEIVSKNAFYDYQAKYTKGFSQYFCPAEIPPVVAENLSNLALKSYRVLGCRGGARVDFRLDAKQNPFVIELNTSPGMTELSLLPMGAKAYGLSFADLVECILDSAGLEIHIGWRSK